MGAIEESLYEDKWRLGYLMTSARNVWGFLPVHKRLNWLVSINVIWIHLPIKLFKE